MFTCECSYVIVISRIGIGGKPKYEKYRPYGGEAQLPGPNFTPCKNTKSPEN